MRNLIRAVLCAAAAASWGLDGGAVAQSVTFGTDWKAEAEHGGYYQAIATGIYRGHGLDVALRQADPRSITHNCSPPGGSISTSRRTRLAR